MPLAAVRATCPICQFPTLARTGVASMEAGNDHVEFAHAATLTPTDPDAPRVLLGLGPARPALDHG